jgi:hypothetical protein
MNKIKNRLFVLACWLAAKAIRMRAKQMLNEGCFVDPTLPVSKYCKDILESDFMEWVCEFIEEV